MSLNSYNRRLITAIYSRSEPSPSSFSALAVLNDYALYKPLTHSLVHFVRSLRRIESDVIESRFFLLWRVVHHYLSVHILQVRDRECWHGQTHVDRISRRTAEGEGQRCRYYEGLAEAEVPRRARIFFAAPAEDRVRIERTV